LEPATREELELALEGAREALPGLLERARAADLAHWLAELEDEQLWEVFDALSLESRSELLEFADEGLRARIVPKLQAHALVQIAEELPPDEAVDILAHAEDQVAEHVLSHVEPETAQELRGLSAYADDSAGGIMTTDFDAFPQDARVGDVIKALRKDEEAAEDEGAGVYVVDDVGRPIGFVSDRELLTTPIHTLLVDVMDDELVTVDPSTDQEEVSHVLAKYGAPSVPVVDEQGAMVGIVTADDAREVFEEEAGEDFLKLVGAAPEAQTRLPIARRVRQRLPMMGLTVLGGLATAKILDIAVGETSDGVHVLRYVPIVIGLAGNVGIQSSTIFVRGLATGEVTAEREFQVLGKEVATGTTIGILCGFVTFGFASVSEAGDTLALDFGFAVGAAIAIAVSFAALIGSLVPILCRRAHFDPAIVAGPLLITVSDVSGTAIFMIVAHLLLHAGVDVAAP
jgi:magnesium transporter